MNTRILAALLLALAAGCNTTTSRDAPRSVPAAAGCEVPQDVRAMQNTILARTNAARTAQGLAPLSMDARLSRAAQTHACDLAARGNLLTHRGSDGTNSFDRAKRAGFPARLVAENTAWGRMSAAQISAGWLASPKHYNNMMHPRVQRMGLGVAVGPKGPSWVQVLAAPF